MNQIEQRPINNLIPYERNPKVHPDGQIDQLANSIAEWGWTVPILVDEQDNVIAGHGRLYAAQRLGMEEVPCIVASGWTEQQKQAYVIADNKLAENGEWDMGLYFAELKQINNKGFNVELMGADQDLQSISFSPIIEPNSVGNEITDVDIDAASEAMGRSIQNFGRDKAASGVEVMCPSCGHSFRFTGT